MQTRSEQVAKEIIVYAENNSTAKAMSFAIEEIENHFNERVKEWNELCPLCKKKCEYSGDKYAGELELWFCKDCEAEIEVRYKITRYAPVKVKINK